jgi:hypothetical protein
MDQEQPTEFNFNYEIETYCPENKDVIKFLENIHKFKKLKKIILIYKNFNDILLSSGFTNTLTEIYINSCYLHKLPQLPVNLITLNCEANLLTELPELPLTLEFLICDINKITKLPKLPNSLFYLNCSHNLLTELPDIRETRLETLYIHTNFITKIDKIPKTIFYFNCSYNYISVLPDLPSNLICFDCSNNYLTELPYLPTSLFYFQRFNNPLTDYYYDPIENGIDIQITELNKLIEYINYIIIKKKSISRNKEIKNELLEISAKITMNPKRILKLLNNNELSFYDNSFSHI